MANKPQKTVALTAASMAASSRRRPEEWLDSQRKFDWTAAGLPQFHNWDEALLVVVNLLANSISPMALMIGPKGILVANESAQDFFAGNTELINGRSVFEVLPDAAEFYASVLELGLSGRAMNFAEQPMRMESPDGRSTRWFNLDFTPVSDTAGMPSAVLGIASEITPLVRRIRSITESEQRLRVALEGSGMVGVWTLDVARNSVTADHNIAHMYGLSVHMCETGIDAEIYKSSIHPEDRPRVNAALSKAIETGSPYRCKYRVIADASQLRWVITSAKPMLDDEGRVARLLGVVVDVTDQMETATALAESRFQFQTLTETLPQIVWSCDGIGTHDYFSKRWSEFTGIQPEDITEDTWKRLVYEEDAPRVAEVWSAALSSGQAYDIDYRFRHQSGEYRWLRVMALPMRGASGEIVRWFGTSTDVHDAYLIAEERERLAHEMERVATEDSLTGLMTRRAFIDSVSAILERNPRSRRHASLLMLDIDHFKVINDTYGHPAGDRVLAIAANRIRAAMRKEDLVGRLGGEEFAVYLPRCSARKALEIAERIRVAMESNPIILEDGRTVVATISIGATTGLESTLTLDKSLVIADKALYNAKAEGRNRTAFSPSAPIQQTAALMAPTVYSRS